MQKVCALIVSIALSGCNGGGRNGDDDDDTTIRAGEEIPIEEQKYFDAKPDLSADGSKLIFVSGRDEQFRLYRFTADDGVSRLTSDDAEFEDEIEGILSPDGSLVAFVASKDRAVDLNLMPFDQSSSAVTVEDDGDAIESSMTFSTDGRLIAFVRRSVDLDGAKIFVGEVNNDGSVTKITQLTPSKVSEEYPKFVQTSTAGSYQMVSQRLDNASFARQLWVRALTVGSEIAVSSEETLDASPAILHGTEPSAGYERIYLATERTAKGEFSANSWEPPGKQATDETVAVQSVLAAVEPDAGDASKIGEQLGVAIVSVSSSKQDGGPVAVVTRDAWSCSKDKLGYVNRVKIVTPTSEAVNELTPTFDEDGVFAGLAETICAEEEGLQIDGKVRSAVVNGDATSDNYTLAYVTLFPKGDNEVALLTYDGTSYSHKKVSDNRKK